MRNRPHYHQFKFALTRILLKIPLIGKSIHRFLFSLKEATKRFVYKNNLFTSLGFNYLGPVDGHNVKAMEQLFQIAKSYNRPTLVHVITTKGKGYSFAESSPKDYHGVSPFDVDQGASDGGKSTFSDVAGATLCRLAKEDDRVCAVTAAMTEGTGLSEFASSFKSRFFDVGIAEQHAVTFSAGLAAKGMIPFFAVYSSFLQRGYDQVIHDIAIGGYPVKLLIDCAGVVGEDGETHQGVFDVSFLSSVPGMVIDSPASFGELETAIQNAAAYDGFCAVRYPRGCEGEVPPDLDVSGDVTVLEGGKKAIVTYGRLFSEAYAAKQQNPEITVIKLNRIYPLPEGFADRLSAYSEIHFFEEGIQNGGIGEHLATALSENGYRGVYKIHAIKGQFVPCSTVKEALHDLGLDKDSMLKAVKS